MADNPELSQAGRILASLALDMHRQNGTLGLRQHEHLRRGLAAVADALDWNRIQGSRAVREAAATKHVSELTHVGADLLERDLADELTRKKGEMQQLRKVVTSIQKLAVDARASFPVEVVYSHTARDGSGGLVTKTVTLTLKDAEEAQTAGAALEKRLESLEKLRDQMLVQLDEKKRQVREMRRGLPGFVTSSNGLLVEVLTLTY